MTQIQARMDITLHSLAPPSRQNSHLIARWLLGILTLLVGLPLQAETPAPVRVGLFDMPPHYSQNVEGKAVGELITTLDHVMTHLGYRWEPAFMTVPELLKAAVDGEVDLLMLVKHPMLEEMALYAKQPMGKLTMLAFHPPQLPSISSLADLRGHQVAVIRGYGYGGMLNQLLSPDNGLRITMVENHLAGMQLLAESEADYLLGYRKPGEAALAQLELQGIQSDLLNEKPVFFVVSKQAQQERSLLSALEQALTAIPGTIANLNAR